jgi:hypothetical protein
MDVRLSGRQADSAEVPLVFPDALITDILHPDFLIF